MGYMAIIQEVRDKLKNGILISEEEALTLGKFPEGAELFDLLALANRVRTGLGDSVSICSVLNAKSGKCPEDCKFCAQSLHNEARATSHSLQEPAKLLEAAKAAEENGAQRIGIVTSGNSLSPAEFESVLETVKLIKSRTTLLVCASLGKLTPERALKLKKAGLSRIHHNLESSENFFGKVCTTHTHADRVQTVQAAKEAGLEVCSGGLIGLGESLEDRISLAFALRDLDVDAIPFNILNPIPGTPLENAKPLETMEILRTLALFRLILPDKTIVLAGGREQNLRDLQALALFSGANGLMAGNYLTTKGQSPSKDLRMILDAGLSLNPGAATKAGAKPANE